MSVTWGTQPKQPFSYRAFLVALFSWAFIGGLSWLIAKFLKHWVIRK